MHLRFRPVCSCSGTAGRASAHLPVTISLLYHQNPTSGLQAQLGESAPRLASPRLTSPRLASPGPQPGRLPASSLSFRRLSTPAEVGPLGLYTANSPLREKSLSADLPSTTPPASLAAMLPAGPADQGSRPAATPAFRPALGAAGKCSPPASRPRRGGHEGRPPGGKPGTPRHSPAVSGTAASEGPAGRWGVSRGTSFGPNEVALGSATRRRGLLQALLGKFAKRCVSPHPSHC